MSEPLTIESVQAVFAILNEALDADGYSASRIVERFREIGVKGITVSHLHSFGLQGIANAITGASMVDELERRAEMAERRASSLESRAHRLAAKPGEL